MPSIDAIPSLIARRSFRHSHQQSIPVQQIALAKCSVNAQLHDRMDAAMSEMQIYPDRSGLSGSLISGLSVSGSSVI